MPALTVILLLFMQPDSARLASHARRAQAEFERTRMFLLPAGVAGSGRRCDARIGRFCYWSDGAGTDLRREPARIGRERSRLLEVLDSVARALPGDAWVAGQRVRYLLEADRAGDAAEAARACRAAAWWCAALEGLAGHAAGDYQRAERWFDTALEDMPQDQRCRWADVSDLLDGPLRRRYRRLSCGDRIGFEARLWWLAQPLWSLPGNDRRTEHYARITMARLLEQAPSPYGLWGDDVRELIVRYGWPVAWERDDGGGTRDPVYIGHEPEPSFHFVPGARAFDDPTPGDEPGVLDSKETRERYAPRYAARFTVLEPAFATFRRGDSILVVATYDVSGDTSFQDGGREVALVLERDARSLPVIERRTRADPEGALVAEAPWTPVLLSLELRGPERRVAARARSAALVPAAGAVALSGILLFEPGDSLPVDLPAALAQVHAGGVRRGKRIGLFWEAYGLAPGADVSTAVTVTPERTSWLRRLAAAVGLAPRSGSVRVEWREPALPRLGRTARALVLDLKGLRAGGYRIDVTISPRGRAPATATRPLDVAEP
jgi:hypothetical protein